VSAGGARRVNRKPGGVRADAAEILRRVEEGGFSHLLLRSAGERYRDAADRALLRELVGGVLRWRGRLDFLLDRYSRRPLSKISPDLLHFLRLGLYQIAFLERVPDWAAVNETVDAARQACGRSAAGFANGVLRAAARQRGAWPEPCRDPADPARFIADQFSLPPWLARRWADCYGAKEAELLAAASAARPRVAFRMPRPPGRTVPDEREVLGSLDAEGVTAEPHPLVPGAWLVTGGLLVASKAFARGQVLVQDPASQLVPRLTGLAPGGRALDACAAPGAKTVLLAELAGSGGAVVAADLHPGRLGLVGENVSRFGLRQVLPLAGNMAAPPLRARSFDTVLVDAPCTGTGTLRRHPDIRWRLDPGAPQAMAATQLAILRGCAGLVADGGSLVYSVCSLEPEEGPGVVRRFLEGSGFRQECAASLLPGGLGSLVLPDGAVRSLPHRDGCDGFYAARLVRT